MQGINMTPTIDELMLTLMPQAFVPAQAQDVSATVQFDFSLDGGGQYVVTIAGGKCETHAGTVDQPDAAILTSQATYLAVAEGRTNAMTAFMMGQLRVSGNLPLLMRFQQMFNFSSSGP
jgi:putative sterol carrier protein